MQPGFITFVMRLSFIILVIKRKPTRRRLLDFSETDIFDAPQADVQSRDRSAIIAGEAENAVVVWLPDRMQDSLIELSAATVLTTRFQATRFSREFNLI